MEHLIFHLIVEAIQAIDRKMQRPMLKAVPELASLRSDPRGFLSSSPITFGPRKRRVLATVIGVVVGLVVVAIMLYVFSHMRKQKNVDPWRVAGVLVSFVAVVFVSRSFAMRLLHGGTATLRLQGVEFSQGDKTMFMPWDLLRTVGTVFEADHKSIVLPINPTIPVALGNEEDRVVATMPVELDTPFAQFDEGQMALKDLYDVRVAEFGALLFEIGQRLGTARNALEQAWAEVPPLAVPEEKGWLRIHLTQLPFPPVCAGCSEYTHETVPVVVAAARRNMTLALPFCRACTAKRRQKLYVALILGAVIGLAAGVALPLLILPKGQREPWVLAAVGLVTAGCVALMAMLICGLVARGQAIPVRWKNYQPDKATLRLKFRWPEKAAGLLDALGISVIKDPATTAT